jgi:hypothetical protein
MRAPLRRPRRLRHECAGLRRTPVIFCIACILFCVSGSAWEHPKPRFAVRVPHHFICSRTHATVLRSCACYGMPSDIRSVLFLVRVYCVRSTVRMVLWPGCSATSTHELAAMLCGHAHHSCIGQRSLYSLPW